ncbi:MAG: discoidin domain-containing protein [Phormidesmis sp.]
MEIKVYKADSMRYTPFDDESNSGLFLKYGIRFIDRVEDCDLILSRFLFVLENYVKYHGNRKKYLLWTHEPRIDTNFSNLIYIDGVPINIMNVYTRDIFTDNYLYSYCLREKIKPSEYLNFDRPMGKKIAIVASYNGHYFSQLTSDGKDLDLCRLRADIATFGYSLGKVDIYGRGWPGSISLEDSRFQLKSTEQFWGDRKLDILQKYHFNLCFENSTFHYYCSEKIWQSIMTGCLPIYYGKGNAIYEDFPSQSFLDYCDFNNPKNLFEYIEKMDVEEYNERMNLCIQAANRVLTEKSVFRSIEKLNQNTISKIQTVLRYKDEKASIIESQSCGSAYSNFKNVALNKPAKQSSTSKYSKKNDPQGAVSGTKSGRYNFHTDCEINPWWQVDLEQIYELEEVRIYNRLDSCRERASSLKIFISDNGLRWAQVHENNPSKDFGGIDGSPLVVKLNSRKARYVRAQLNAVEVLHLDQVEVYADLTIPSNLTA